MKETKRKKLTRDYGITLIALVVTIVVLLILAGISLNLVLGNNGIITKAKEAKEVQVDATIREELGMLQMEDKIATAENEEFDLLGKIQEKTWCENATQNEDIITVKATNGKKYLVTDSGIEETKTLDDYGEGLKIGDYVNYNPTPVTVTSTSQIIQDLQKYSGYTGADHNTETQIKQETLKWRVLDIQNGKLRLISEKPTTGTVYLNSYNGYNNAVYLLDELSRDLYSGDKGTAQNLKIEDIQNHLTYDYTQYENTKVDTGKYGGTREYTETSYIRYPSIFENEKTGWVDGIQGKKYNLSEQTSLIEQSEEKSGTEKIKITQTLWKKAMEITDFKDQMYHTLFIKNSANYNPYWISSRCTDADNFFAIPTTTYNINIVKAGEVTKQYLYLSVGAKYDGDYGVRPVITLNADVKLTKNADGTTWNIDE